jgi:hypothetical protein
MEPVRRNFLYEDVLPRVALIGWPLAVLGLIFRFMLLRGGSVLLMVGIGTLAYVYFLRAFEPAKLDFDQPDFDYEPVATSDSNFMLNEVAPKMQGIAIAVTLIGTLFKLLFWKGAMSILLAGTVSLTIVLAIQLYADKMLREALLFAALGAIMLSIPTDDLVREIYRDDQALVEKMLYQQHHPHDRTAAQEVSRLLQLRGRR